MIDKPSLLQSTRAPWMAALALGLLTPGTQAEAQSTSTATSGAPNIEAQMAAMEKLSFLHGRWNGTNRTWGSNGQVTVSPSRDVIEPLLNGTLLTIHGFSFPAGSTTGSKPSGENYGILRYDDHSRSLRVRAWFNGHEQEGTGTVIDAGHAEWRLNSPIGLVRFVVKAQGTDGWLETGEISKDDGATWTKSFEIVFTRTR